MSIHNEFFGTHMSIEMNINTRSIHTQCQSVSYSENWTNWKSKKF